MGILLEPCKNPVVRDIFQYYGLDCTFLRFISRVLKNERKMQYHAAVELNHPAIPSFELYFMVKECACLTMQHRVRWRGKKATTPERWEKCFGVTGQ